MGSRPDDCQLPRLFCGDEHVIELRGHIVSTCLFHPTLVHAHTLSDWGATPAQRVVRCDGVEVYLRAHHRCPETFFAWVNETPVREPPPSGCVVA